MLPLVKILTGIEGMSRVGRSTGQLYTSTLGAFSIRASATSSIGSACDVHSLSSCKSIPAVCRGEQTSGGASESPTANGHAPYPLSARTRAATHSPTPHAPRQRDPPRPRASAVRRIAETTLAATGAPRDAWSNPSTIYSTPPPPSPTPARSAPSSFEFGRSLTFRTRVAVFRRFVPSVRAVVSLEDSESGARVPSARAPAASSPVALTLLLPPHEGLQVHRLASFEWKAGSPCCVAAPRFAAATLYPWRLAPIHPRPRPSAARAHACAASNSPT
ncbi:hypothetical protein FB451DRAFT_1358845 [Mycena latifolia]|nr:hypothetical protein FB451DRAFT_1358845 [Mycena latifolia]